MNSGDEVVNAAVSNTAGLRDTQTRRPKGHSPTPLLPPIEIDFDMVVIGGTVQETVVPLQQLEAACNYEVTVTVCPGVGGVAGGQGGWRLREQAFAVSLACSGYPELIIEADVDQTRWRLPSPTAVLLTRDLLGTGVSLSFTITVPGNCPRVRADLELQCSRQHCQDNRFVAFEVILRHPVEFAGATALVDESSFREFGVDPSHMPPENVAFVWVTEDSMGQTNRFCVRGFEKRRGGTDAWRCAKPAFSLRPLLDHHDNRQDIYGWFLRFSRNMARHGRELTLYPWRKWVLELLAYRSDDLVVVIVDRTDTEIPWEMVRLGGGQYLGTMAEVVRWADVSELECDVELRVIDEHRSGGMLTFVAGEGTDAEREELTFMDGENLTSLDEVWDRLHADLSEVGLIYLGCHGHICCDGKSEESLARGTQALSGGESVLTNFAIESVDRGEGPLPVAFVNACGSGWLSWCAGEGWQGMPDVFLAKVASAFVGTLGKVPDPYAGEVGARILRLLRSAGGGVRLSKALKDLRLEAAGDLHKRSESRDEGIERFLCYFMYVYYGNPFLRLTIRGKDGDDR